MMALGFDPELRPAFAPLDLLAQLLGDLQPRGFERVVAGGGVDVRAGHGQMHMSAEGWSAVRLPFQHHFGEGDRDELMQAFELLLQPGAQGGVGVEAANSELDFRKRDVGVFDLRWGESSYAASR